MSVAELRIGPALSVSCPNCGWPVEQAVAVVRKEDGKPGWLGCKKCWDRALSRGQLPAIQQMVRALDTPLKKNK